MEPSDSDEPWTAANNIAIVNFQQVIDATNTRWNVGEMETLQNMIETQEHSKINRYFIASVWTQFFPEKFRNCTKIIVLKKFFNQFGSQYRIQARADFFPLEIARAA